MTFETLPVLHLDQGAFPEYPGAEPDRVLTDLARRFGRVAIVDVGGVRSNDADLEFIQQASRRRALWLDAGSRFGTDAMDLFIAGAEALTIRWNTVQRAEELAETAELCQPGSLFIGMEYPKGEFLHNPRDKRSPADVVRLAESLSAGIVFIVDDPTDTLLRGLPGARTPRYVQGNASPTTLQEMGFAGALLPPTLLPKEKTDE